MLSLLQLLPEVRPRTFYRKSHLITPVFLTSSYLVIYIYIFLIAP